MPDPINPVAALNPFSRSVVHLTMYFKDPDSADSDRQKLAPPERDLFARLAIDAFLSPHDIILPDGIPTPASLSAGQSEFPTRSNSMDFTFRRI
jgi:hypothetical protein